VQQVSGQSASATIGSELNGTSRGKSAKGRKMSAWRGCVNGGAALELANNNDNAKCAEAWPANNNINKFKAVCAHIKKRQQQQPFGH